MKNISPKKNIILLNSEEEKLLKKYMQMIINIQILQKKVFYKEIIMK